MAPKRKVAGSKTAKVADSHAAATDFESNVHPTSKRQRVEAFFDDSNEATPESQPRRSSRASKGNGGQLQQLHLLESMQVAKPSWSSARELAIATKGQNINPMAPSYYYPTRGDDDEESQVPPWAESSGTLAGPSFTRAQPGDQFGFKLPEETFTSDADTGFIRDRPRVRQASVMSSGESQQSSHSSILSAALSRAASTAPTSRAPSECEPNLDQGSKFDLATQRSSLLHGSSSLPVTPDLEEVPRPLGRSTQICRTQSFVQIPSSLSRSHTLFTEEERVIDEISPSEDERIAESNLRQGTVSTDEYHEHSASVATAFRACQVSDPVAYLTAAQVQGRAQAHAISHAQGTVATSNHDEPRPDVHTTRLQRGEGPAPASRSGAAQVQRRGQAVAGIQDIVPTGNDGHHPDPTAATRSQHSQVPVPMFRPGEVEDVVAQYRQHNRAPPLPSNIRLLAVRDEQRVQRSRSVSRDGSSVSNDRDNFDVPISASLRPPSADHSASANLTSASADPPSAVDPSCTSTNLPSAPTDQPSVPSGAIVKHSENVNPSQLHFYPPAVHDILECAKQFSHCDLGSINAFPLRPQFNVLAVDYVDEAVAERRTRGLTIPTGWWPEHSNDITKLLWEDIGNWRSALKKRARVFTRERYEWDPQNRRHVNADITKALLSGGSFLKDGLDEYGHTNNLTHPALSGVINDFFYTGSLSVGNLFPGVFGKEVPRAAVALAATAIKVALDEIAAESKDVSFKRDIYADVYIEILGLMSKCDTSPVHRAKTSVLRKHWAKIGSNNNGKMTGTATGFDVDLD